MSDVIRFPGPSSASNAPTDPQSIKYRRRAAQLGRLADAEADETRMLTLIHQALSWIQLAENEELLANTPERSVVLIVEDEPFQRMDATAAIEAAGFDVLQADSADTAITFLETRSDIAVVFTDIRICGSVDGARLTASIRDRWPEVKIIATSGFPDAHEIEVPQGGLFLPKPYSHAQVVGTLRELTRA